MSLPLSTVILRWLDPKGEKQRREMRAVRCLVDANAEDLTRTMSMHRDEIQALLRHVAKGRNDAT